MRYKVWIALIICGTLLVLAPPTSDYLSGRLITQVLIDRTDFNSVNVGIAPMSSEYRFGCWLLGAVMIAIGVVGGWREQVGTPDEI